MIVRKFSVIWNSIQDQIVWEKQLFEISNKNVHFRHENGDNAQMKWR